MRQMNMVDYLNFVFSHRKAKNAKYSLRAFAQFLGVHSATLSTILAGKRTLTAKQTLRLLDKLGVQDEATRLRLLGGTAPSPAAPKPLDPLDLKVFATVRGWEHTAIMAACLVNPLLSEKDLSRKLGLPESEVEAALQRLKDVRMISRDAGGWKIQNERHSVSSPVPSDDLRECHRQFLGKAQESLQNDAAIRDFSGVTITANPEKLALVRDAIKEFRLKMAELLDDERATAVYRLNVQLFPLSKESLR